MQSVQSRVCLAHSIHRMCLLSDSPRVSGVFFLLQIPYEDEGDYVVIKHASLFTSTILSKVLQVTFSSSPFSPYHAEKAGSVVGLLHFNKHFVYLAGF